MKITKPEGTVIECSVEEYNNIEKTDKMSIGIDIVDKAMEKLEAPKPKKKSPGRPKKSPGRPKKSPGKQ